MKFEGDKKNLTSEASIGQEIGEAHLDSLKKIIYVKRKIEGILVKGSK